MSNPARFVSSENRRDNNGSDYTSIRIQGYKDIRIQGYKDTRIQGYKDTRI